MGAGLLVVAAMIVVYLLLPEPTGEDPPWLVFVTIAVVLSSTRGGCLGAAPDQPVQHPLRTGFVLLPVMMTAMVVIFALDLPVAEHQRPGRTSTSRSTRSAPSTSR